ncbi:MAG TPA: hypothetical protein VEK15_16635 [Vicinamibacteria bacterium]|nr:hypothetical protein [Vicinamibacteria bacterium]
MTRLGPVIVLAVAAPLVLVTFIGEHPLFSWLFSFLTMSFPVALIALGVSSRGRLLSLKWDLIALFASLQASGFGMLATRGSDARWLAGLPPGAIFMLAGLWLLPLLVSSWAYARTFSDAVLDAETLERVRSSKNLT